MAKEIRCNVNSKFLTLPEMQGQIIGFLAAGYETTATTLAFTAYYLAVNPNVQCKLQQEIDEHFPTENHKINYETVHVNSYRSPYSTLGFKCH